jgi:aspartate/methionine/tyrosine aminotransferase
MRNGYDIYSGAQRLKNVYISPIRTMLDKAKAMEDQGLPVVRLLAGEPDFPTPEDIKEGTVRAIRNNLTHYGSNRGQPRLRRAIARLLEKDGIHCDPETEILVTSSGAEAINNALLSFIDPGDEVILFTPAFVNYENLILLCGGTAEDIPLKIENGFQIDLKEVAARITEKTKMIVLNNPCNPTGAVYPRETLAGLAHLAIRHNLLVFTDEIYSRLTYGTDFCAMASLPGMKERTITMNGFSKTYAMTGWRLGYLASDKRLVSHMVRAHQYATTCSPTFIQEGLADGIDTEDTNRAVEKMVAEFALRRELIMAGLDRIPKLRYAPPQGAFYVFVDVSKTGLNGDDFARRLLDEKYVATVPGAPLGKGCENFIRLSFATSQENIREGIKRLAEFVEGL